MELLRTDSEAQLFERYADLKYAGGNWTRAADRIDNIVDNHIKADPIKNRDYLVELRYRYDADVKAGRPYSFTTEFIYHEDERDGYCWLNDWYEGQQDIDVMRIIAVDEIDEFESIEYTTSKLSDGYIPADITPENYANIFDATIKSWMNKHEMYTDVIVRLAYKVKSDPEIKIRNEFLEFNGNEGNLMIWNFSMLQGLSIRMTSRSIPPCIRNMKRRHIVKQSAMYRVRLMVRHSHIVQRVYTESLMEP